MSEWDAPMRETLAKLEMLSHGATVSYNKSGGESGEPDDKVAGQVARGVEEPPHVLFRRRYDDQAGDVGRRTVWEEADAELKAWKRRTAPVQNTISEDEQILEDGEGWDPEWVGRRFDRSPAWVRRLRQRNGRHSETGLPAASDTGDLTDWIVNMNRGGLSQPQIAKRLGTSQATVSRTLKMHRFRRQSVR